MLGHMIVRNEVEPLEQEDESELDILSEKMRLLYAQETKIEGGKKLYLITWSPDAKELPDVGFEMQHNYCIELLLEYLKACSCGAFCVESTALGIPHYHGWYQVNPTMELYRISMVKVLRRFGNVKIDSHITTYKVGCYSQKANALWYYKKDMDDAMFTIKHNPITIECDFTIDLSAYSMAAFFSNKGVAHVCLQEKVSDRKFLMDFYKN